MHNRFTSRFKSHGKTKKMGFVLDDPEQWDDVAEIPDEIGNRIINDFNSGLGLNQLRPSMPADQVWILEFLAMYHKSYA